MKRLGIIFILLVSTRLMEAPCGATGVSLLRSFSTTSLTKGVTASGSLIFIANGEEGVKILDAGSIGSPIVGSYDTPGFAFDVVALDDILYVADGNNGLLILDIAQPEAISPLGRYPTFGIAKSVEVSETYAFLIDYAYGFQIVDISNPALPCYAGHSADLGDIWSMRMGTDGYLYIADLGNGLRIWDVEDPERPFEIGRFDTPGYALDIALSGSLALVADAWNGFLLLDVADPSGPVELVHVPTTGYAFATEISDGFVYLSEDTAGLRIIPLTEFSAEKTIGEINSGLSIYDIAVYGKFAFAAAGQDGALIFDAFEAIQPRVTLTLNGSHQATINPWEQLQWDLQIDARGFGCPGFFSDRQGKIYFSLISGDGNLYSLVPWNTWSSGFLPLEAGVRAKDIRTLEVGLPEMAGDLPGACFIPHRNVQAYVGFLSDSDDDADGFPDLFFDHVNLLFWANPPEVKVFVNDAEGIVTVADDQQISVHAYVIPGDYGETEAVVYALLVFPDMELVMALNDEEQWDPAVVPYRSSIALSNLGRFSLIDEFPADIVPAGDYDFYVGIQLPYDHDCDGSPDFYYGMARLAVKNHDHL